MTRPRGGSLVGQHPGANLLLQPLDEQLTSCGSCILVWQPWEQGFWPAPGGFAGLGPLLPLARGAAWVQPSPWLEPAGVHGADACEACCAVLGEWEGVGPATTFLPGPSTHHSPSKCFSLVAESCPTLCDPTDCSTPGFPFHCLPELAQIHCPLSW